MGFDKFGFEGGFSTSVALNVLLNFALEFAGTLNSRVIS